MPSNHMIYALTPPPVLSTGWPGRRMRALRRRRLTFRHGYLSVLQNLHAFLVPRPVAGARGTGKEKGGMCMSRTVQAVAA